MIKYHLLQFVAQVDLSPLPNNGTNDAPSNMLATILQILFGTLGAIAVLIIVIAGLRYMLAGGDPAGTAKARNTIIYALIGLAVCLAAYSIVGLVVKGVA